jgi:hypothetical protein
MKDRTMTETEIRTELADCKTADRYVVDNRGVRYWVFGIPTGNLLVRRIENGVMKPVRTMQYDEVVSIEGMKVVQTTTNNGSRTMPVSDRNRELCIANDEGVMEDGFYDILTAQNRMNEIGDGEVQYRDLYDDDGQWIEESEDDEE